MCFEGIARLSRRVWRRFVRGSREISLVPSLHRASTDALILTWLSYTHLPTVLNLASSLKFDAPLKLIERTLVSYVVRGISPATSLEMDMRLVVPVERAEMPGMVMTPGDVQSRMVGLT